MKTTQYSIRIAPARAESAFVIRRRKPRNLFSDGQVYFNLRDPVRPQSENSCQRPGVYL